LRRIGDPSADHFQQIVYAHALILQGRYREALEICESGGVSRMNHGIGQIAHFGALSGKTLALLRMGRLGEVLRITQAGRESVRENLARSWALDFREAWLRTMAFDFDGAKRICDAISASRPVYLAGQPETIGGIAAGCLAISKQQYPLAIEHFNMVSAPDVKTKFFLHWVWRITAKLESSTAWLSCGDVGRARIEAAGALESALSTADPHLQALAWELNARIALANNNREYARECVERSLAIVENFEIMVAAWQVHATAWQLYDRFEEHGKAEIQRQSAEACILKIADSFSPEEPLREIFLSAEPVRRILHEGAVSEVMHRL
jgi:tetratricopeptide (TPR) repeat protein